ncbi:MAG: hypothetical protein D6767_04835 [Candidatus Hydrogenedentota bacterium]|nr:MAG: hypothetical protein D6767_04835 [Candidatus Hydrogenedentota bacterium]
MRKILYGMIVLLSFLFLKNAYPVYSTFWILLAAILQILFVSFSFSIYARETIPFLKKILIFAIFAISITVLLMNWLPFGLYVFLAEVFMIIVSFLWQSKMIQKVSFSFFWFVCLILLWHIIFFSVKLSYDLAKPKFVKSFRAMQPANWKTVSYHPFLFLAYRDNIPFFLTPIPVATFWLPPLQTFETEKRQPVTACSVVQASLQDALGFSQRYFRQVSHYSWAYFAAPVQPYPLTVRKQQGMFLPFEVYSMAGKAYWGFWFFPIDLHSTFVLEVYSFSPDHVQYLLDRVFQACFKAKPLP